MPVLFSEIHTQKFSQECSDAGDDEWLFSLFTNTRQMKWYVTALIQN